MFVNTVIIGRSHTVTWKSYEIFSEKKKKQRDQGNQILDLGEYSDLPGDWAVTPLERDSSALFWHISIEGRFRW